MYLIRNSISSCFWFKPQTLYIVYQRTKRKDLSTYDALTKISDVYKYTLLICNVKIFALSTENPETFRIYRLQISSFIFHYI